MSTEKNLTNLVINKVESQDVYDYMKANSLINADELYVVAGGDQIATETDDGLMSSEDKLKLDNIEENANNYIHPAYTSRSNGLYKVTIDSTGHVSNVTAVEKDDITDLGIPAQDTTYSEATTSSSGLMSATDKARLDRLVASGGEANQNAFSNVAVGSVTVAADNATDTLTLESGDNVIISADSTSDKITISAVDTVYTHPTYTAKSSGLYKVTVDSTGHVSAATAVTKADITALGIPGEDTNTTYSEATTATSGLMSSSDKIKLNNIAEGAEVNQNAFSNITIGNTTISADSKTDTLTLVAGNNVTITPDATNDKITIAATDTTYGAAGTSLGLVQSGGDVTISSGVITVNDDSHNHIIANVDGLQASIDSKVDKVTGKGLSTNDLTDALKANYNAAYTHSQQAHAPADAEKNIIVGVQKNGTDLTVNSSTRKVNITVPTKTSELTNDSDFATTTQLGTKVDKVTGKGLSTNDYTTEEKTKLSNIEGGANKTIVDTALSSTSTNPVQNKVINTKLDSMQSDIDSKVPSSRTVNGKALTANITLSASDVGALPNTTQIPSIDGLATETYVDNKVAGLVDSAPAALDTLNELAAALGDDPNFATTVATQIGTKVDKVDGKGLSTNDYTNAEKTKLSGIAEGAQVNQNAFSNVVVGSTTVSADSTTDTLTLIAGDNVTLTPNATSDSITIAATDTVYTHPSYTARTGVPTANQTPSFGGTFTISQPVSDSTGHITAINSRTVTIPSSAASTSANGLMTSTQVTKLNGIAEGAQVNQNAFSNVVVGSTTIAADSTTDTLTLAAGNNVTITPDATNDKVTISAIDTVYTHPTYTSKSSGMYKITVDGTGHVSAATAITKADITGLGIPAQDTTYSTATTTANGLMSSGDKSKLNGIASGAQVNQNAFSNITVGSTTVAADSTTDTLTLVAGSNVILTPDATNDKITIAATDTVYAHPTYTSKSSGLYKITVDGTGHVSAATAVTKSDITALGIPAQDTTYSTGNSTTAGITKLYTGTGTATDGTMTQSAITSAIDELAKAENGQYVVTTAGIGAAYTATVPGITSLTAGASFIMVPHTASTSTAPTLNVNGLGAKTIKRRISSIATTLQSGYTSSWLASGKPFRVIYDGAYWIAEGHDKPVAADLYGTLAVSKGGTGATTAADARTNLGAAPAYTYGTEDLVAGTSELATGTLYFVYE